MTKRSGASYRPGDGMIYIPSALDHKKLLVTLAVIECHFDNVCDKDEAEMAFSKRLRSHVMKNAIIRTLIFVPEILITLLIQGYTEAFAKLEMQCLYWSFIRGKIDEKDLADGSSVLSLESIERLKDKK